MGEIIDIKDKEDIEFVLPCGQAIRVACVNYLGVDILDIPPENRLQFIEMIYKACVAEYLDSIQD